MVAVTVLEWRLRMVKPLSLTLFGSPHIVLADQEIIFSFSKMNALLFYLAIHKTSTRDEMANLLWPDKSEKDAKRNLRNTIYQVNKLLDGEYIKSLNNKLLQLNPDYPISCDVDAFLACPQQAFGLYKGPFLKNFYIRDSEEYDFWLLNQRASYEQTYLQERYRAIESQIEQEEFAGMEQDLHYLISLDEFDERFYQLLMRYYRKTQRTTKVIDVYHQLSSLLESELGITPSKETRSLYEEALKAVQKQTSSPLIAQPSIFVGRHYEIQLIETELKAFLQDQDYRSIHLEGRFGMGKQTLCKRVLADFSDQVQVVSLQAFPTEEETGYLAWTPTLAVLAKKDRKVPLSPSNIQEIVSYFSQLAQQKKLVFLIANLQWLDQSSYQLLAHLLHFLSEQAFFLLTSRPLDKRKDWSVLTDAKLGNHLLHLPLTELSLTENDNLIGHFLSKPDLPAQFNQNLYQKSKGNPFFASEYCHLYKLSGTLEGISSRMQEAFQHLLDGCSPLQKELLLLLAYFKHGLSFSLWLKLAKIPEEEMTLLLDDLLHQHLIDEGDSKEPTYSFLLPAFQDYLYSWHSMARRRLVHKQIAQTLEEEKDDSYYDQIAYHYRQAKEDLLSLHFRVQHLQRISMRDYELFPIYTKKALIQKNKGQTQNWNILDEFQALHTDLETLEERYGQHHDYQQTLMAFLLLEGKYHIRYEVYEKGLDNIHRVIAKAKDFGDKAYLFEGYKQLIYHCIQTDHVQPMGNYVQKALDLAISSNNHEQIGISLRLQGLYELMNGQLETAKQALQASLNYFSLTSTMQEIYSTNIAATYDYLAEIHRIQHQTKLALTYQKKALNCLDSQSTGAQAAIFHTNMAMTYYQQGKPKQARSHFKQADACFQRTSSTWRKAQLEAYKALDFLQQKELDQLCYYFQEVKENQHPMPNPRDLGIQYTLKAMTKSQLERGQLTDSRLSALLSQKTSYYKRRASELLSPIRDSYCLALLESIEI